MNYKLLLASIFAIFLLTPTNSGYAQGTTAEYMVTFQSTWSASTHPNGFPSNPHFSGLIGATHDSTITFWEPGELATNGIETMAETGGKFSLTSEINNAVDFQDAEHLLSGGGIGISPGTVTLSFEISDAYPLVTLVSMLAPSPDWFVGVHDLNLFDNGAWVDELMVDLFVYDAGTDSGANYTSSDADTQPAEPIAIIETTPFLIGDVVEQVGTFTFKLISSVGREEEVELPQVHEIGDIYPNPFSSQAQFTVSLSKTEQVQINVFDLLGRQVQTLFEGTLPAGIHHPFHIDGKTLLNGLYVVHIKGEQSSAARMFTLIR